MTNLNMPFEDQKVWEYLRWYSYLSEKYKLLYISTPKVACTSLKWWFASMEGYAQALSNVEDSKQPDPELVIHDSFHKIAPAIAGLTPDQLSQAVVSNTYFRFAVVRNPYKRIFSAWQSKLLLREPFTADPYAMYDFFGFPIKSKMDIALAFEGFLEHLASHEAPVYWDPHWTPQVNLLRPDLIAYTNISQIENTRELKVQLAKHLGPDIPDPFAHRRANESLIPYLPEFITERAGKLIRSLYRGDFQTFGYDDSPPVAKDEYSSAELDVAIQAIGLIRGRHKRLGDMFEQLVARDEQLVTRNEQIVNLNEQIVNLNEQIVNLNEQIVNLNEQIVTRDEQIVNLNEQIVTRDEQIFSFNQAFLERNELQTTLNAIYQSRSWKFIETLRKIRKMILGR